MARWLALEWDLREARFVVASLRRGSLRVESAFAIPFPPPAEGEAGPPAECGSIIRAALAAHKVRASKTIVTVARSALELRILQLPPASDDELAELVHHQTSAELRKSDDDASIDYMPLDEASTTGPRSVIVAGLAAEPGQLVTRIIADSGVRPSQLLVRPCAAAARLRQIQDVPADTSYLIVDASDHAAEMTVLRGGRVVFSRGVLLPSSHDGGVPGEALSGEINRTMIAVQNQPAGEAIDAVYLFSVGDEHEAMRDAVAERIPVPLHVVDPFGELDVVPGAEIPHRGGRFAALLGSLVETNDGTKPVLDLANPRRPPKRRDPRRTYIAAAAVGAALVLAAAWMAYSQVAQLDDRIARLQQESKELDGLVKKANEKEEAAQLIGEWADGEIVWLDELHQLSNRFPPPRDAVIARLQMARGIDGGTIDLEGLVRAPSVVGRMEDRLRDARHEVRSKRVQESLREKTYTWQFESSLSILREPLPSEVVARADRSPRSTSGDDPSSTPEEPADDFDGTRISSPDPATGGSTPTREDASP